MYHFYIMAFHGYIILIIIFEIYFREKLLFLAFSYYLFLEKKIQENPSGYILYNNKFILF